MVGFHSSYNQMAVPEGPWDLARYRNGYRRLPVRPPMSFGWVPYVSAKQSPHIPRIPSCFLHSFLAPLPLLFRRYILLAHPCQSLGGLRCLIILERELSLSGHFGILGTETNRVMTYPLRACLASPLAGGT